MREAWKAGREELNKEYEKAKNEKAEKNTQKIKKKVDNELVIYKE
jgi:hypothetical protein